MTAPPPVRFALVGLEHAHAYGLTLGLLGAGAELAGFHSDDDAAAGSFGALFGADGRRDSAEEILHDERIDLVVVVDVPSQRAGVSVAALRAGKHVVSDKPAVTTAAQLAELRDAQAESGRWCSVWFSERLDSRATMRALRLVRDGAIGAVVQIVGFGPHRLGLESRPPWFLDPVRNGGILNDLAAHQLDQVLVFAGHDDGRLDDVELAASMVANRAHPEHPGFEDYGEVHVRTPGCAGTVRVDWFTPAGMPTWGDVRLFVVGTEGTIEVRKNVDLAGRNGGDHLLVVDHQGVRRLDCQQDELDGFNRLLDDVRHGTETHMAQAHAFAVTGLALRAQTEAVRLGHLRTGAGDG